MDNYGHLAFAGFVGGVTAVGFNALRATPAFLTTVTSTLALLPTTIQSSLGTPILAALNPLTLNFTLLAIIALGAMFPDIDHPQTKIFKYALATLFIATAWLTLPYFNGNYWSAVGAGALAMLAAYLIKPRHRGITHTKKAALAYALITLGLTQQLGLALVALTSYWSHLMGDSK